MKLYKAHGVNPAAGCLPVLIQLPVIWALYAVLQNIVFLNSQEVVAHVNSVVYFSFLKLGVPWDQYFFGLSLAKSPSQLFGSVGIIVSLVPILTGVFQLIQSKMMMPSNPSKNVKQGGKKKEDFASSFQSQSTYIFPFMIAFLSFTFPIGLSLYWNTFTIFGIIQQYQIAGMGGLGPWIKKAKALRK